MNDTDKLKKLAKNCKIKAIDDDTLRAVLRQGMGRSSKKWTSHKRRQYWVKCMDCNKGCYSFDSRFGMCDECEEKCYKKMKDTPIEYQ
jgi:acetyl-CoA carboxylase beta subunit